MGRKTWLRSLSLVALLLTLLPLNAQSIVEARPTPPESAQPQSVPLAQGESSAITARITPATPPAPPPIRLTIGDFTPTLGETLDVPPDLHAGFSATQPEDGYYLVQFKGPIEEGWKIAVQNAGAILFDYVPDFTFISYMDTGALARVQALPEVLWIGPYEPAYKLSPDLADAAGTLDLNVQTFPIDSRSNLTSQFEALDARIKDASEQSTGGLFRMSIEAAQLHALAKIPAVRWIEPFYEQVLFNDVARSNAIMAAETVWADLGLYGAGQVVAVTDTGLDTGNLTTLHQDFLGAPTGCTGTNRVVATFALGRPPSNWSDSCGTSSGGHGTHVAGSVLGNGCRSNSEGLPIGYKNSYAGLAPQASLVFQSVMDSACGLGGLPTDLNTLYSQADTAGAHIHTNSWGAAVSGQYTTNSQNTDLYVWEHKDYVILFAAGNEGTDGTSSDGYINPDSMSAPGTAKNCITVGASENYRLTGGYNPGGACSTWGGCWPSDYPTSPINSDRLSDNAAGMVAFSSRGPTDDGRIKPDVVAPGSNILSTKSQATNVSGGWGAGPNQYYQYNGGTSMATPLTAGGVALVREFYTDIENVTPSAALVKATVINSAVDLYPGQYDSPLEQNPRLPNNAQGWGRVNIANATDGTHLYEDISDTNGLATGGNHTYTYNNCSAGVFKVTLVWSDYRGSTLVSKQLVNDLDLTVTAPDGSTTYYGNVFSNGWAAVGGSADRVNNVESVYINAPATGTWTVKVSGYNVPQGESGKQGYALVVDMPNNVCDPDFTLEVTPANLDICQGETATYNVALGSIAHFNSPVSLSASGNPGSVVFSPNPATPPDNGSTNSTLSLSGAAAGTYAFDVIGTSGALTHQQTVNLRIQTGTPGTADLLSPASGSVNVPRDVTFNWEPADGADTYILQIATSPDFTQNLQEFADLTTTSHVATLVADTVYYWRVRADNPCGAGPFYSSATFRTSTILCEPPVLNDPSFEQGVPNASWQESDTATIGGVQSPICSNTRCGGPPPSASDGSWWLWFGGLTSVRISSVEQTATFPHNTTSLSLSFDLQAAACNNKNDYLRIFVGGIQVFEIKKGNLLCDASSYSHQVIPLDPVIYAGNQQIRIIGESNGNPGGWSNFHLDNLAIEYTCPLMPYNAVCGNLPGSYGMACHRELTGSTLQLGTTWGNQDGIEFGDFVAGESNPVTVNVQGTPADSSYMRVWFDWDDNGVFDDTEMVHQGAAINGSNTVNVFVPAGLAQPVAYRVRLYDGQPVTLLAQDNRSYGDTDGGDIADGTSPSPVPTAVSLASFAAASQGEGILVTWETAAELQNLGFNLYRAESAAGPWTQMNAELIPTQNPGAVFGASYEWLDTGVTPGAATYYRLEDVDVSGASTFHGPVSATAVGATSVAITSFGAHGVTPALLLLTLATVAVLSVQRRLRSDKVRA